MLGRGGRLVVAPALGCLLGVALSGCFASPPQIISLQPNHGSIGVPGNTPIVVQFDRPVVPQSVIGRFSVTPAIAGCDLTQAFSADPGAPCRIVWFAGDTGFALEHPRAVLASNRVYTFSLAAGFADPQGAVNTVDHSWQITTATAPAVRGITPGDGDTGVPADAPLVVTFSTNMTAATTQRAISLSPAIPGTVVVRSHDHSRFLVLPGHPLQPGVTYRLEVSLGATDENGQALLLPAVSTFTAGGMTAAGHAVVLAARPGEPPSAVLTALLAAAGTGDPAPAETVLVAPRCQAPSGCGRVPVGGLLYTYAAAALAPDARWLAVVEDDQTAAGAPPTLVVLQPASGAVAAVIPGGSLPAWSPDGQAVAFAEGAAVDVFRPAAGSLVQLPAGDPLLRPPAWGVHDELLALDVQAAGGTEQVQLADTIVGARYAVPSLSGPSSNPLVSPDGSQLALERTVRGRQGTWLVPLGDAAGPPHLLDTRIQPVGWEDTGTLFAVVPASSGGSQLVAVSISTDERTPIPVALSGGTLSSVAVASSGRQLGYLSTDAAGVVQAVIENSDGSDLAPLTSFAAGGVEAASVVLS